MRNHTPPQQPAEKKQCTQPTGRPHLQRAELTYRLPSHLLQELPRGCPAPNLPRDRSRNSHVAAPCLQPLMTAALHTADTDFFFFFSLPQNLLPVPVPLTPDKMSICLINTSDLCPALSAAFCTQFRCSLPEPAVNL